MTTFKRSFFLVSLLVILLKLSLFTVEEKALPFVIILVDAPYFDYKDGNSFFESLKKRAKNTEATFGHAWVLLKGTLKGKPLFFECGFSGERGDIGYFKGMDQLFRKKDPNPVRYLQTPLKDGFLEQGAGKHTPTMAAKINLTDDQFEAIFNFIGSYSYPTYDLSSKQCVTFIADILGVIDLTVDTWTRISIPEWLTIEGQNYRMWSDKRFSSFCFHSPDALEYELSRLIKEGKAQEAYEDYFTLKQAYNSQVQFEPPPLHATRCQQIKLRR
ncbi:hypothetical protein [Criblamydia sequanensis]|uniref:Conserved putative secreted protein n=1 Tax=Candidatus Criblamydia sequanensis CRIB-18 TaxID=1437425 RepID=A0A090D1R6_9BACT|nr:hypothetical protein [Criblamydia sequanensis]CDR33693.1 Conserved putative secreted protein [Criblamydia sequanensis CRIB-18]